MDRLQQIEEIFQEALQRDPAERDAWLRDACRDDSDLRREVASLLANRKGSADSAPWAAAAAAQLIGGSLKAGHRLGPYEIIELIGAGGMGEVYKARDTRLQREVAIKICAARFSERFEREARVIASLNHANICHLYDIGPNFLVMELVEGENLSGPLPVETALNYARQIAEALEAAHEKGIVHRDLKPGNVKITPAGMVKVLDFGLAKAAEEAVAPGNPSDSPTQTISVTRAGVILGTAAYMSPEQARGAAVDKRADIWAFGCVLYEMLAAKPAFTGETTTDILAAVLRADPDWSALPPATPLRIRKLLRRCLERDRKQRLRDIGEARITIDAPEESGARTQRAGTSVWPWAITVVLAAALLGVVLRRAPEPLPRPVSRWTATVPASEVVDLELSRDGTRLVYRGGSSGLTLRILDRLEARRLTDAGSVGPAFSPDGQWIVYYAGEKLKKIRVTGGASIDICEAPRQRGRTWGDDDTIVFGTIDGGLMRVPAAGGTPYALTSPNRAKGEVAHQWPHFMPGAEAIVFTINTGGTYESARIGVLDLKHGSYRAVVDGASNGRYVPTGHLVYQRSGSLFAAPFDSRRLSVTGPEAPVIEDLGSKALALRQYSFSDSGLLVYIGTGGSLHDRRIEWVDRQGNTQASALPSRLYTDVRLSPNGRQVALTIANNGSDVSASERGDIWIGDLELGRLIRLTSDGSNTSPVWTPDGRRITFSSSRAGRQLMANIAADGSRNPEILLETSDQLFPMSWTPGGDLLLYRRVLASQTWLLPLRTSGEAKPRILETGLGENRRDTQVSPDGRWIAYESNESGTFGRFEIYVRPFPGPGRKLPVSTGGGETPRWSPSGRELFYLDPVKSQLMAADVQSSPEFHFGRPHALFALHATSAGIFAPKPNWDVAPNGTRFLFIASPDNQESSGQLQVVVNWFDELRRRVPMGGK